MIEQMSLEEEAGLFEDDPAVVYESDVDWASEEEAREEKLAEQRENDREVATCCGGTAWDCAHYGYRMSRSDYRRKYEEDE